MSAFAAPSRSLFVDRVMALLDEADCRRPERVEELEEVYALRYTAYLREGAIAPNPGKRLSDEFDQNPNTWIMGVYLHGRLASSIRLSICTPAYPECPAARVFPDLLTARIAAGQTIVDPTRFVIDHRLARSYPKLAYVTVRLAWLASEFFGADVLLATPRVEHQAFYRRLFGHRAVSGPRWYATLKKPHSLMMLDYPDARDSVNERYPFLASNPGERAALFDRGREKPQARRTDLPGRFALSA